MRRNTLSKVVIAGLMLLGASLPAQAAQIKWNLDDVTFTDGTTASGSFTIDAAAHTWSAFDITTTNGALSAFHYDPTNSGLYFNGFGPNSFIIMPGDGRRYVTFSFLQALTDAGGTQAINTPSSWECMNCSPWRNMTGSVTTLSADVPEPATMAMVLPALGMLGWMSRRSKKPAAR
jgi:hypothetical protein